MPEAVRLPPKSAEILIGVDGDASFGAVILKTAFFHVCPEASDHLIAIEGTLACNASECLVRVHRTGHRRWLGAAYHKAEGLELCSDSGVAAAEIAGVSAPCAGN